MKLVIASDHGGYEIKEFLKTVLNRKHVQADDLGCHSRESCDYPDYASLVAEEVSSGKAEQGILICTTGVGMSIAANRYPRVRAALCMTPEMAVMARTHNNANVLVLGAKYITKEVAEAIAGKWLESLFSKEERHAKRVEKLGLSSTQTMEIEALRDGDPEIYEAVASEIKRQQNTINLIASENYVTRSVRAAQGCVMTNKYAEGYPGKRYYNGCQYVDIAERLAINRAKTLFKCDHANVQPHCGSSANMAVYFAVLKPGDTVVAMSLAHGGHLTHGHAVNFSGRFFNFVPYGVEKESEVINYDEVEKLVKTHKPSLIVVGASAYPRFLDFKRFREIADSCGALLMVDMAHLAGLIAGGAHPDPVPYADFVTTTTHKTLRGPRSGMILCRQKFAAEIDKQVFPGLQGGPLMHTIAAKAVCFHECLQPSFREYAHQIVRNARTLADALKGAGLRLVSGGTDNHLMLVDVTSLGLTGKDAALALDKAGIIVNKNAIPFDQKSPFVTSGIRVGTPAATTRGMKEPEMLQIAAMMVDVLRNAANEPVAAKTKEKVAELATRFPAP